MSLEKRKKKEKENFQEQKMAEVGNAADSKWGEKKMEVEDSVRTVDCLRGRLLAEREASRNAKEQALILENKLMELENLLKQEAKTRNRAEKKLKLLMKKLESMNIESEHSGLGDKSDISSLSSTTSSSLQENQQMKIGSQEPKENAKFQKGKNDSQNCLLSSDDCSVIEGSSNSAFEVSLQEIKVPEDVKGNIAQNGDSLSSPSDAHSERSSHLGSSQCYNDQEMDEKSDRAKSSQDGLNQEGDLDHHIDNSMALVPFDMPQKNQTIDPEVLDVTVKQVLESLRQAKEQLQNSMERRRMMNMIKVG